MLLVVLSPKSQNQVLTELLGALLVSVKCTLSGKQKSAELVKKPAPGLG